VGSEEEAGAWIAAGRIRGGREEGRRLRLPQTRMGKPQHGSGRGRSPFVRAYALTLAFITFVSVLYFKDFSSSMHQPFLHRPPRHHRRQISLPVHHVSILLLLSASVGFRVYVNASC
jgi:hypothetical protein